MARCLRVVCGQPLAHLGQSAHGQPKLHLPRGRRMRGSPPAHLPVLRRAILAAVLVLDVARMGLVEWLLGTPVHAGWGGAGSAPKVTLKPWMLAGLWGESLCSCFDGFRPIVPKTTLDAADEQNTWTAQDGKPADEETEADGEILC